MARRRQRRYAKRGDRMVTSWWRPGCLALSQLSTGTQTASTVLMNAGDLIAQPSAVLDREAVIKVLRIICKIVLLVTGGGNASVIQMSYGFQIDSVSDAGTAISNPSDPRQTAASDKRQDWIYVEQAAVSIAAADNLALKAIGREGENALMLDWEPKRLIKYGQALGFAYAFTDLNAGFGGGSLVNGYITPEILVGRVP